MMGGFRAARITVKTVLPRDFISLTVTNCHIRQRTSSPHRWHQLQGHVFQAKPKMNETLDLEPFTMNLQKMDQRAGLQRMNNGHHGAFYDQIEADRVPQRGLVLATVQGAFFDASGVLGGLRPTLPVSLYSLFIVVSFLLNGALRVGTCPISPSLQLLGVVVRTKKYGHVRRMALNAIMAVFPLDTSIFSVVLFCFSAFPALWNDMECHYQWQVAFSFP